MRLNITQAKFKPILGGLEGGLPCALIQVAFHLLALDQHV